MITYRLHFPASLFGKFSLKFSFLSVLADVLVVVVVIGSECSVLKLHSFILTYFLGFFFFAGFTLLKEGSCATQQLWLGFRLGIWSGLLRSWRLARSVRLARVCVFHYSANDFENVFELGSLDAIFKTILSTVVTI